MSSLVTPSQALEGSELQISYDTWHLGDDRAPLPHMGIIRMAGVPKMEIPQVMGMVYIQMYHGKIENG